MLSIKKLVNYLEHIKRTAKNLLITQLLVSTYILIGANMLLLVSKKAR